MKIKIIKLDLLISPELISSLKLLLITSIFSGTLAGCSLNSTQPNYDVDSRILVRSAIFTQRELINTQLALTGSSESSSDAVSTETLHNKTRSTATLLNNYCDLIERATIYVTENNIPAQCSNRLINHQTRRCAMKFHQCVELCPLRSNDCQPCIEHADQCLE